MIKDKKREGGLVIKSMKGEINGVEERSPPSVPPRGGKI